MNKIKILTLVVGLVAVATSQLVDLTRTPGTSGPEVVKSVIDIIRRSCIFEDDILYLRRVAFVESHDGLDAGTYRPGYDGGIWKVDEATLTTTKSDLALAPYWKAIKASLFIDWSTVTWADLKKPLYSALAAQLAAIARGGIPSTIETQATFWAQGGAGAHDFIVLINQLTSSVTYSNSVDVAFVLDSSASLSIDDFERTKEFVRKVVQGFDIDGGMVRVAVVEYSSNVYPQLGLDNGMSKADIGVAVANLTYIPGGTNTKEALEYANTIVFQSQNGARPSAAKVVILVTDGISDDPTGTVTAANTLINAGVNIFTVGVGSTVDKDYLNTLASDPKCTHVKTVSNYTDLPAINYEIQQMSLQSSVILQPGMYKFSCSDKINAQVKAPLQGATVTITPDGGEINVYGTGANSFTPSSVLYMFNDTASMVSPVQLFLRDNTQLNLAIRNATTNGCTSSYTVNIEPGNLIKLGNHLQCFESNLLNPCTYVEFNNSPYIRAGAPGLSIPNVCLGVQNYFIVPYPSMNDRYVYCYLGQMIIVYCQNTQIFDLTLERCIKPPTTMPPTTSTTTTIRTTMAATTAAPSPTTERPTPAATQPPTQAPTTAAPEVKPTTATPTTKQAVVVTQIPLANPCTPDNIALGLFLWPVAGDNTSYIKCDIFPYTGKVLKCEAHHYYSQAQLTCLFSEVVIDPTPGNFSSLANPCSIIHDGDVQFHPHPTDEHKYIQCDDFGEAFVKDCMGTEVWYQAYLTCIPKGPLVG